eukprot:11143098-Alexandrium_andersonii.AAC.1
MAARHCLLEVERSRRERAEGDKPSPSRGRERMGQPIWAVSKRMRVGSATKSSAWAIFVVEWGPS